MAKSQITISEALEAEVLKFYLAPNSAREIERKYGINLYQLKKLLEKHGLAMHSKSDIYKLREIRTEEVCLAKYGVTNPFAADSVKNKIKQSMLGRYGVEYVGQAEISKQKSTATFLERYGVERYTQTEQAKTQYAEHLAEYKRKEFETKKLLGTCRTSKPEENFYKFLCNKYGKDAVLRQYYDPIRYPFHCDFYILPIDLFIELNFSWTHGRHPFNAENKEDLSKLVRWQEKAKLSKYYESAILTWTQRDPQKMAKAKEHNLNYKAFYDEVSLYEQFT